MDNIVYVDPDTKIVRLSYADVDGTEKPMLERHVIKDAKRPMDVGEVFGKTKPKRGGKK
jgi:hypothetical protein